jgi:archaellum component FlaF (FlaF/FlaG flagellin family)
MEGAMNMRQNRRALSSIVGAIFMVLIMIGALNAYLYATQEQGRLWSALTGESNANQNRLNEKIDITNVRVDGNRLNVTVTSTGGQVANIKTLYIVNETNNQQYRYDINKIVDSRKSEVNIGQESQITTVRSDAKYTVKLVTASGNTASAVVTPPSALTLPMALYVIPPSVAPGQNITALFAVTNNTPDSYVASDVTPVIDTTPIGCTEGAGCQLILREGPTPSSATIPRGATAIFKWTFDTTDLPDGIDRTVRFNATVSGAKQGNYVIENGRVGLFPALTTETVISEDLQQKPDVFLIVPGPFGESDSSDEGVFGVTVVNPTQTAMTVSRVVIAAFSPNTDSSFEVFEKNNCDDTEIFPAVEAEWSCTTANVYEWNNIASPQSVDARSAKSFISKLEPGKIGTEAVSSFNFIVTVFTSMGTFSSVGYSSSMQAGGNGAIANVYMSSDASTPLTSIKGNLLGLKKNTTMKMNITIADFDDPSGAENYIKSGARLVINVPRTFTNIVITSSSGFVTPVPDPILYPDGSYQIVATTNEHIGDAGQEAKVLQFTATAPDTGSDTKLYLMHVLVDGQTDDSFSIGAYAQIPVQVIP